MVAPEVRHCGPGPILKNYKIQLYNKNVLIFKIFFLIYI